MSHKVRSGSRYWDPRESRNRSVVWERYFYQVSSLLSIRFAKGWDLDKSWTVKTWAVCDRHVWFIIWQHNDYNYNAKNLLSCLMINLCRLFSCKLWTKVQIKTMATMDNSSNAFDYIHAHTYTYSKTVIALWSPILFTNPHLPNICIKLLTKETWN